MKKTRIIGLAMAAAIIVVVAGTTMFSPFAPKASASPAGTPDVQLQSGDGGSNVQQCSGGNWASSGASTAQGGGEQDCIRTRIQGNTPTTVYNRDFRVCLTLSGNGTQQCTGWASDSNGSANLSPVIDGGNQFNSASITVYDRALPAGIEGITGVEVGVQLFWKSDNQACALGRTNGMQWSGSDSPSGWATGDHNDDDPGCGRVGLVAAPIATPNAAFVAENLADTVPPNTTYANNTITMRNTGSVWSSDNLTRISGDCSNWHPTAIGQTCVERYQASSSNFVLKRIDTNTDRITAPATLPYNRIVTRTYTSFNPCVAYAPSTASRLASLLFPVAHAASPIEPQGGDGGVEGPCVPTPPEVSVTEIPWRNVLTSQTADFPITFSSLGVLGQTTIRYQMLRVSDQRLFGETANVDINVVQDSGSPDFSFICQTLQQTVNAGQVASYTVNAGATNNFAGTVNVAVSGMPTGASSPGGSFTLAANATSSTVIPVLTASSTPSGTSTLTFTANAQNGTTSIQHSCQSQLVVRGTNGDQTGNPPLSVRLDALPNSGAAPLNGVDLQATVTGNATGTLTYNFYCDRADTSTNTDTPPTPVATFTNVNNTFQAVPDACSYGAPGSYIAKVIVERGGLATEARAPVTVLPVIIEPPTLSCTFAATPNRLFIPPARPTTLSWQCNAPTTCTVSNVTDSRTVTTGGQQGQGEDRPPHSTTYRLSCGNGSVVQDQQVRVFDINTRIEILPQ